MELNAESEFASRVRASHPRKHRDSFAEKQFLTIMEALAWAPASIKPETIRSWQRRLARPAPWVIDAMVDRIRREAHERLALADQLQGCAGPGKGWNKGAKTLAVWRARQAEEREAKKKAAELAALHNPNQVGD
jgi:hypothetical protein